MHVLGSVCVHMPCVTSVRQLCGRPWGRWQLSFRVTATQLGGHCDPFSREGVSLARVSRSVLPDPGLLSVAIQCL